MGLIREPKNVDFYVLGKPTLTLEEEREFSEYIKKLKARSKTKRAAPKKRSKAKAA